MGTPSYMAPEQASGNAHEAGPAADVYALGAILYCCLAGRPPFRGSTVVETLEQVRTQEPAPPSRWQAGVPLDLDTICLKCLRKEPENRYTSAAELADELARYLSGEPILARPVGRVERAVKWVKRNPAVAGAAAAVALALTAGATVSYLQYLDAVRQKGIAQQRQGEAEALSKLAEERRKDAEEQTQTALQISQFLSGLFEDNTPIAFTGRVFGKQLRDAREFTALDVVDRGAAKLKTSLTDKPSIRIRAALLERIGNVYIDLGHWQKAKPLLEEALELRRREYGTDHLEFASSLQSLGLMHMSSAEMEQACQAFERALAIRRKHLGESHPLVADTLLYLGFQRALLNDLPAAERELRECLSIRRRSFGAESREVVAALFALVGAYLLNGEPDKGGALLNQTIPLADKLDGKSDFSDLVGLFLKSQLAGTSDTQKMRALYEEGKLLLGEHHIFLATIRSRFAHILLAGDPETAVKLFRAVVESYRHSFGPDVLSITGRLRDLAVAERKVKRFAEAEASLREALRVHRKHNNQQPRHLVERSECLILLAQLLYHDERGTPDEADECSREGLGLRLRGAHVDKSPEMKTEVWTKLTAEMLLRRQHSATATNTSKWADDLARAR